MKITIRYAGQLSAIFAALARSGRLGVLAAAVLILPAAGFIAGANLSAPGRVASGGSGNFAARDATDYACIDSMESTDYKDIPGMEVTFDLGGEEPQSVIVMFQARWRLGNQEVNPPFNGVPRIQLVIDGVPHLDPGGDGRAAVTPNTLRGLNFDQTNGFNFISDPLKPGTHTAKIQWRVESVDDESCIEGRSLIVLHR